MEHNVWKNSSEQCPEKNTYLFLFNYNKQKIRKITKIHRTYTVVYIYLFSPVTIRLK